jgi:hypothetical protein
MNLIVDEGVDQPIVLALRKAGFSVVYYAEEAPGTEDVVILERASSAGGLLLTCDKDRLWRAGISQSNDDSGRGLAPVIPVAAELESEVGSGGT